MRVDKTIMFILLLTVVFLLNAQRVIAVCEIAGYAFNILSERVTPENWPYSGEVAIVCGPQIQYTSLSSTGFFSAFFGDFMNTCDICNGYVYINVTNYDAGVYGEFETSPPEGSHIITVPVFLNKTLEPNAVIPFFAMHPEDFGSDWAFIKAGVVSEQALNNCQLYWNDDIIDMPFEATPYGGYNCSINMTGLVRGRYAYRVGAISQGGGSGFTDWRVLYVLPSGLQRLINTSHVSWSILY